MVGVSPAVLVNIAKTEKKTPILGIFTELTRLFDCKCWNDAYTSGAGRALDCPVSVLVDGVKSLRYQVFAGWPAACHIFTAVLRCDASCGSPSDSNV